MPAQYQLGLVTYMWGAQWDLPTLLKNCQDTDVTGVELRVDHKHGVSPALTAAQRAEVRKMFDESGITLVGLGCNWSFHHADPAKLKANIDGAKEYIALGHDIGATGVKVKPDDLPKEVPVEKTIEQIARSLRELGEFGEGFGQQIRLEVHGRNTAAPGVCKQIMQATNHPNVVVCWNCNPIDLEPPGLAANFNMLIKHFGETVHIHELDNTGNTYPWPEFFKLLNAANYEGWTLLECSSKPADPVEELRKNKALFDKLTSA